MAASGDSEPSTGLEATVAAHGRASREIARLPAVGDVLGGRYELVEVLGRGAFGVVYRARDRVAADTVAVKVFSRDRRDDTQVARMRAELRMARKVTHPAVVRIHDLIEAGDYLVLSMELVAGTTLQSRLNEPTPLPPDEWLALVRDLAGALAAAHTAGVVHRDLKPANVLLRTGGGALISDFGISRMAQVPEIEALAHTQDSGESVELTRDGVLMGTPLYMAPEQLQGARVDAASDRYALGVLLYQAATGDLPHQGLTVRELVDATRTLPPALASRRKDLPVAVCNVVDELLSVDRARRPGLDALLDALQRPRTLARRRSRRWWLGAGTVALVAAALGWWIARGDRGAAPVHARRLALIAHDETQPAQPELAAAIADLARHRWGADPRFEVVADPAGADALLDLGYVVTGDRVTLRVRAPRGRVVEATAPSVSAALDEVSSRLGEVVRLDAHRPPSQDEAAAMAELGAPSHEALLAYRRIELAYYLATDTDEHAITEQTRALLRSNPTWARPYLVLAMLQGVTTDAAKATLREARATADTARDPGAWRSIHLFAMVGTGAFDEKALLADPGNVDAVEANVRMVLLDNAGRTETALAIARRLHERRPFLQFGLSLITMLEAAGRADEVPALVRDWIVAAPGGESALIASVQQAVDAGDLDRAETLVRRLLLLHGDSWSRQVLLADVLITADRLADARAVTDRLLSSIPVAKARGLYRQGVIAILEGRFAAAREVLAEALLVNRPLGFGGETTQVLEAMVSLSTDPEETDRLLADLATLLTQFDDVTRASTVRYELALRAARSRSSRECPAMEPLLAGLDDRRARRARIDLQRLAAAHGCATCEAVVDAGLSPRESTARSTILFARCAERLGDRALAERAFTLAQRGRFSAFGDTDPYERVLARYELGRLAELRGDRPAALTHYRAFLDHWGRSDRSLPEVTAAEAALDRLR